MAKLNSMGSKESNAIHHQVEMIERDHLKTADDNMYLKPTPGYGNINFPEADDENGDETLEVGLSNIRKSRYF